MRIENESKLVGSVCLRIIHGCFGSICELISRGKLQADVVHKRSLLHLLSFACHFAS